MRRRPRSARASSALLLALASLAGAAAEREPARDPTPRQVEEARRTFTDARARFAAGLPRGQRLVVLTRIYDERCWPEVMSFTVARIDGDIVHGRFRAASKVSPHYRAGDWYAFPESQLLGWAMEGG